MLTSIRCSRFTEGTISFHQGLNVVLGDEEASNSIGKSTLLMLIDFAHGGQDFLDRTPEVASTLGAHSYEIGFKFLGTTFRVRRTTAAPKTVVLLDSSGDVEQTMDLSDYSDWLKHQYKLDGEHLSFRACVSPFSRVWERETLDPKKPLHAVPRQPGDAVVDNLLKLYRRFDELAELKEKLKQLKDEKKQLKKAQRLGLIPSIRRKDYRANKEKIGLAEAELAEIRESLASFATNISELANREVLEATQEKDGLLKQKLELNARLERLQRSLDDTTSRHRTTNFEQLTSFFPEIDVGRLASIDLFHRGISDIMKDELRTAKTEVQTQIALVQDRLNELDATLTQLHEHVDTPKHIVDRVIAVASNIQQFRRANEFYDRKEALDVEVKGLDSDLREEREQQLSEVSQVINGTLEQLASKAYPVGHAAPVLKLSSGNYEFDVPSDTGTGTAYAAAILLDLAVLTTSQLPYVIHDSLFLKNIDIPTVRRLVNLYASFTGKQVFIAIDEIAKFGEPTAQTLSDQSVVQLTSDALLYDLEWSTET